MSSPTWTPPELASERRRFSRPLLAGRRSAAPRLDDEAGRYAGGARGAGSRRSNRPSRSIPPECRHLHYLLVTPFRYQSAVSARFALPARGLHARRLLRLAHGGHRGRRNGVPPAAVLRRVAADAVAGQRRRVHRVRRRDPHACRAGSDAARRSMRTARSWMHCTDYEPCQTLAAASARRAASTSFATIRSRPRSRHQHRRAVVPRVRVRRSGGATDLAPALRVRRRPCRLRIPRRAHGIRSAGVLPRSADCGTGVGSLRDIAIRRHPGHDPTEGRNRGTTAGTHTRPDVDRRRTDTALCSDHASEDARDPSRRPAILRRPRLLQRRSKCTATLDAVRGNESSRPLAFELTERADSVRVDRWCFRSNCQGTPDVSHVSLRLHLLRRGRRRTEGAARHRRTRGGADAELPPRVRLEAGTHPELWFDEATSETTAIGQRCARH